MSKGPLLLLGAAAVAGIAIAVHSKSAEQSTTPSPAPSKGTSAKDLTTAQKNKLEAWAKSKGVPVDKAYALAQDLFSTKF